MSRETWVWRNGQLVEKHLAEPTHTADRAPSVIADTMKDAAAHPCTGKMMDSKSAFRRVTREHGCVEVGNASFPVAQRQESSIADIARGLARNWR